MSLLWPDISKADTTIVGRFGRVLHWLSLAIAAITCVVTVWTWKADGWNETTLDRQIDFVVGPFIAALVIYAAGRALRYILSGE